MLGVQRRRRRSRGPPRGRRRLRAAAVRRRTGPSQPRAADPERRRLGDIPLDHPARPYPTRPAGLSSRLRTRPAGMRERARWRRPSLRSILWPRLRQERKPVVLEAARAIDCATEQDAVWWNIALVRRGFHSSSRPGRARPRGYLGVAACRAGPPSDSSIRQRVGSAPPVSIRTLPVAAPRQPTRPLRRTPGPAMAPACSAAYARAPGRYHRSACAASVATPRPLEAATAWCAGRILARHPHLPGSRSPGDRLLASAAAPGAVLGSSARPSRGTPLPASTSCRIRSPTGRYLNARAGRRSARRLGQRAPLAAPASITST